MKNFLCTKGLVIGIIILFLGAGVLPSIRGDSEIEKNRVLNQNNAKASVSSTLTDWWPMFRHDLSRSGYSTSSSPSTNNIVWRALAGCGFQRDSPAVVDGKGYIVQSDLMYCWNSYTGAPLWNARIGTLPNTGNVWGGVAVSEGNVYCGSTDNNVYCIGDGGSEVWRFVTGGMVESSPAILNDRVYIGSDDGKLYCLNAVNGVKIWEFTTGAGVSCSPTVVFGSPTRIYFGSDKMYCLDGDGAKLWEQSVGISDSSPAVSYGNVYVGSVDGKMYCFNALTGAKQWEFPTHYIYVLNSPAVYNQRVYFCEQSAYDCTFYCLDALTGVKQWEYLTGRGGYSSPAVADGKVYFGSMDCKLYCLNADTGKKIWDYATGDIITMSPAIADGKVYIGSNDHYFYCFGSGPIGSDLIIHDQSGLIGEDIYESPIWSGVEQNGGFIIHIGPLYIGKIELKNDGTGTLVGHTIETFSVSGSPTWSMLYYNNGNLGSMSIPASKNDGKEVLPGGSRWLYLVVLNLNSGPFKIGVHVHSLSDEQDSVILSS